MMPANPYEIQVAILFRSATKDDLPLLEWYGQYLHFRRHFEKTFREQSSGHRLMMVGDINGFPVARIFLLLNVRMRRGDQPGDKLGYLYSLRVMDHLQGFGIGTQLVIQAEKMLRAQDHQWATISANKDNPRARQLYERLGYRVYAEDAGDWKYINHLGKIVHVQEPCWMLEKRLDSENPSP